jgi:CheY-like chemotaxis protein
MEAEVKVEEPDQKRNEEKQGRSGAERSEDAPKNRRILLVEDNSLNQEIAKELLEMTGVTVECAENGEEAVQRIVSSEDGYYDLVFMDIHMPVMDGYEATRQIRAGDRAYLKKLPIIAVSASAFDEDAYEAKSAGMNDHIAKPLDLEVLTRVLAAWLAPSDPGEQTEICPIKIDNDRNV